MWYQLQIESCLPEVVEQLSDFLEELGSLSITLTDKHDEPVLEPELGTTPLWPTVVLSALFADKALAHHAQDRLALLYPHFETHIQEIVDQDWERAWMEDFQPVAFGERFWVCPSWTAPPDPDAINLILDPGLAFGTGSHPTTHLCLEWLAKADLTGKIIIDYGCGSGILALASLKLGAHSAFAVDIDPQALQATTANADVNGMSKAHLQVSFPDTLNEPADILIANILLGPLIDLQESFHRLIKPKGILVVSGILTEQTEDLIEAYKAHFTYQTTQQLEAWSLVVFQSS